MQALEHLIGELIDGKYRIDKLLGKGGMGAVYLATHMGTDRPVALKVITPQFMGSDEFVARFQREARAAGRLRHPNVVNVTDFGFARLNNERIAYLVMEYLDGCTLAEILAEESQLPLDWVADILEQACSALDEAHRQGIVHRDLKPDNIWLEPNRRGGYTVKVLDFGLAKLADTTPSVSAPDANSAHTSSIAPAAPLRDETPSLAAVTLHLPSPGAVEAKTQLQPANKAVPVADAPASDALEATTQLQPPSKTAPVADALEAATQMLSANKAVPGTEEEEHTRMLPNQPMQQPAQQPTRQAEHHTQQQHEATQTGTTDGLTRVGSIMGTPLYMSPEQCRGEALDARSDIYNLGVIAYQMLAGETPFKGDMATVMKSHIETPPPPLREKRKDVPKKVEQVVLSALAKNPDERPARAGSFASALSAYVERPTGLLRRAITLASEHFPVFLRLSLLIYAPLIILTIAQSVTDWLTVFRVIPKTPGTIATACLQMINAFLTMFTVTLLVGMTSRVVTQLLAAPLRPIQLRPAFDALWKRLWPFITTSLRLQFTTVLLFLLGIIPGIIYAINAALTAPVIMIEGLKGKAAIARSKVLTKRYKRMVILILLIEIVIPAVVVGTLTGVTTIVVTALGGGGKPAPLIRRGNFQFSLSGSPQPTVARIITLIAIPINLFLHMLSAILTSLLYLTTRQAGGETLKETLSQFEEEEMPNRKWQQRMRERQLSSSYTRPSSKG